MSFEERPHTADILMHIRAPDLPGLFSEAGRALMKIMYRGDAGKGAEMTITVTGSSLDQLLHTFLSELLFTTEVENIVFSEIAIEIEDGTVHAKLTGEPFQMAVHGGGTEVKGISWHGLVIRCDTDEYSCDILFDV